MLNWRARAVLLAIAIALAVALSSCGTPAPTGGPSGVSPTPTQAQAPTTTPTPAPPVVTVAGEVKQILSDGDFVLDDGHQEYTIAMSSTAKIVNLSGHEVTRQLIQVVGSVQVTGTLSGSTISAQTVLIPTKLDRP